MYITIDNIKIHYNYFDGDPQFPTTLLLHGWGASVDTMQGIFDNFKNQNKSVVSVDIPPFGSSDEPPNDYNIHKYARLIKNFILQLGFVCINIIAHSFGGRISLILASEEHSEFCIQKLVLTGCAGLKPKRGLKYHLKVCSYKIKKRLGLKQKKAGSSDYQALPDNLKPIFIKVVNTHLDNLLLKIKTPTLIVFGVNDKDTPPYMAKKLHKGIKNSKLIMLENASHYAFLDNPAEFNEIINAFL